MRNILISIKPEHCCNILNKDKILEIRTSCPAEWKKYLDGKTSVKPEPCKVCIYCTKGKGYKESLYLADDDKYDIDYYVPSDDNFVLNGKVVAEFILNKVEELENTILPTIPTCVYLTKTKRYASAVEKASCLSQDKIYTYLSGRDGYAWHIDDLIIYDTPKKLSDFKKENKYYYANYEEGCCCENCAFYDLKDCDGKYSKIYKAPQSWCYVEEKGVNYESICN